MGVFIKDEDYIYLDAPYMEAYIEKDLFEPADRADKASVIAAMVGDSFHLIGVFNVRVFNDPDADREKIKLRTFCYPNLIETKPSEFTQMKLTLTDSLPETQYYVLKYYRGDIVMQSKVKKDSLNSEKYLNMMMSAKLPDSIPYKDLSSLWLKNFNINDVGLGVPVVTIEAMVATLCRDKNNPKNPYRMIAGKNVNYDQQGYLPINARQVTSYTNVMSALTFEDMGTMLTSSINMSRSNTGQSESPFEDILRM